MTMSHNVIDVIVPVYNVSKYLKKCVDSLITQEFENYMILLVDDGSTDDCSIICDEYEIKYPDKIKVLHKENGGLSDARNEGVKYSNADFIVFVDSDDYVEPTFLANLYDGYLKSGADIVISSYKKEFIDVNGVTVGIVNGPSFEGLFYTKNALIELLYEKLYKGYAWGKMYKSELVKKYPFPKGKYFEDVYTIYKQINDSKSVYCTGRLDYYYIQRDNSIMNQNFKMKHMDLIYAVSEMLNYLADKNYGPELDYAMGYRMCQASHITLRHAVNSSLFSECYDISTKYFREYIGMTMRNKRVNFYEKIIFYLMYRFPKIYRFIFSQKNKLSGRKR